MYSIWTLDGLWLDDVMVFEGTLEECLAYVEEDEYPEELYILEPDGFTVYGTYVIE